MNGSCTHIDNMNKLFCVIDTAVFCDTLLYSVYCVIITHTPNLSKLYLVANANLVLNPVRFEFSIVIIMFTTYISSAVFSE